MRKRRSTSVKGKFEDAGRYVKCWRCGFHVDTKRVVQSTEESYFMPEIISPVLSGNPELVKLYIDKYNMVGNAGELNIDGTLKTDYYMPKKAVVNSGSMCAFCGTSNLP